MTCDLCFVHAAIKRFFTSQGYLITFETGPIRFNFLTREDGGGKGGVVAGCRSSDSQFSTLTYSCIARFSLPLLECLRSFIFTGLTGGAQVSLPV